MNCVDCEKVIWPWQKFGIDGRSHRSCHTKRCFRLIKEMPEAADEILIEIKRIKDFYAR